MAQSRKIVDQPKGKLINPQAQFRFSLFMGGVSLAILVIFIGVTVFVLDRAIGHLELSQGLQPGMAALLRNTFTVPLAIAIAVAAALSGLSVLLGILWSHRVYGPVVPLTRHIQELKCGNFASRVHLRKNDHLIELQNALNDLAEALEARYGASGSEDSVLKSNS